MADWWSTAAPIAVGVVLMLAPGLLIAWAGGARGLYALAAAGPFSIASTGLGAVAGPILGIHFGWWMPACTSVLLSVTAWVLSGRRLRRSRRDGSSRTPAGPVAAAAAGAVLSSAIVGWVAFRGVGSPDMPSQTYDGVFHLNAVARILDSGDASSFHLYRVAHPGDGVEFYPGGWHASVAIVAELTGATIPAATAALWLVVNGLVFALGSALLARALFPNLPAAAIGATAALSACVTPAAPYLLLEWGVLYPTGLAYALMPFGLATCTLLARVGHLRSAAPLLASSTLWLLAEVFAHPRSLISFVVVITPLAIAVLLRALATASASWSRRRLIIYLTGGTTAVLGAVAATAAAVLLYFDVSSRPISDRLNGGPATAHQSLTESLIQAVAMSPPAGPSEASLSPSWIVAALIAGGLGVCLTTPKNRWIAISYMLVVVLYALAAGSNSDLAKLATGFWYKDKFRLFAVLGILAPPLISLALVVVARWITGVARDRRFLMRMAAVSLAPVLALMAAATAAPGLREIGGSIAAGFAIGETKNGALLDSAEYELLRDLPGLVPEGSVVAGNPWNGSVLSWAVGGREALFPHLTGDWGADRSLIAGRLALVAQDPEVCEALGRLGVEYVIASDGLLWGGDPQADFYAGMDPVASAPGFEVVETRGATSLLRVTACG